MSEFKRATSKTVVDVLRRYADWLEGEPTGAREEAAEELNVMLGRLLGNDFFGTEGQCDPRGDHRS